MSHSPSSARTPSRRIRRILLLALTAGVTALVVALIRWPTGSSSAGTTPSGRPSASAERSPHGKEPASPPGARQGAVGAADGVVPDGVTVFDDAVPAVANLDPNLRTALQKAAKAAGRDGVTFYVNSGWRSKAYQDQLLRRAVAEYGSADEAARRVATATTSPHVKGEAVDLGRADATAWLSRHGAAYGLCQIYRNEAWHYELRADADQSGCPAMYADPTEDPRMRQ
ncbi:M15 family metallopeptidase [Streptomyces sp. VRA16 Mangrove soil]|uniref:M15 family metallopeptidase n=1 Tax=Streptomyces sp. VRA16 Mangrove soil TaxID=2817434 RepID=UPI001A9DEB28|nr:M15 family metallopeptidase [Streptomyces sp. VRA16 Mangrove soil]MBO1330670.1 M15 family metallopeptidase [Streptomyces sp. VRA16 Mangrove soil]